MDFKQLEVFVAVAKHQSFSKAARELFFNSTYCKCTHTEFRERVGNCSYK